MPPFDVKTDETMSPKDDKRSTFTPEGPPSFIVQLSPPIAPSTFPDIKNLIHNIPRVRHDILISNIGMQYKKHHIPRVTT